MSAWPTVALGTVAEINRIGVDPRTLTPGTKYVGLENIASGGGFVHSVTLANGDLASTKFRFNEKHLLFGKLRPYLAKIVSIDFAGVCSTDILPILPGPCINREYLRHYLLQPSVVAYTASLASGVNLPRLSPAALMALMIPLPPLNEQQRIADILDRADALRAKRRAAIVLLDTLTESIFLDMFGDLIAAGETDGSTLLGELLTFVTSGSRGWAEYYAPSGTRFVRSLDVQMNLITSDSAVFVNPPSNAEARRTCIQEGDVLLTITGSRIGRVAAAPKDLAGAYVSQHVAILRLDQFRVIPEFVAYFLSMKVGGQQQIAKAQYGQTKPGLNLDQIRNLRVPLPSIADQQEFKKRLNAVSSVAVLQTKAMAKLDDLFFSLQHRAFRGEL